MFPVSALLRFGAVSEFCSPVLSSDHFALLPDPDSYQSLAALECSQSYVLHESLLLSSADGVVLLCQQVRDVLASVLIDCSQPPVGLLCPLFTAFCQTSH